MKDLIKKYGIIGVIIAITLFLFITGKLDKCSSNDLNDSVYQVELSSIKKHIVDSMALEQAKRDIFVIDSVNSKRDIERSTLSAKIKKEKKNSSDLERERDTLLAHYNDDMTEQSMICDSIISMDTKIIKTKDTIIKHLDIKVNSFVLSLNDERKKIDILAGETKRIRTMYEDCDKSTKLLIEQLHKQDTWWKRNEKWFYFGGGVISVSGLVYLLKP